jgi:hypothetical protein
MTREEEQRVRMNFCNCGSQPTRVLRDFLPWSDSRQTDLQLIFHDQRGEIVAERKGLTGFDDIEPDAFYFVPAGECLNGTVELGSRFDLTRAPKSTPRTVIWSGDLIGDGERWHIHEELVLDRN